MSYDVLPLGISSRSKRLLGGRFQRLVYIPWDSGDGFSPGPQSQVCLIQDDFCTENHSRHQHQHVPSAPPPRCFLLTGAS